MKRQWGVRFECISNAGANLENAVITGANFAEADLTGVNFEDTLVREDCFFSLPLAIPL